jgi:hypothetical protein
MPEDQLTELKFFVIFIRFSGKFRDSTSNFIQLSFRAIIHQSPYHNFFSEFVYRKFPPVSVLAVNCSAVVSSGWSCMKHLFHASGVHLSWPHKSWNKLPPTHPSPLSLFPFIAETTYQVLPWLFRELGAGRCVFRSLVTTSPDRSPEENFGKTRQCYPHTEMISSLRSTFWYLGVGWDWVRLIRRQIFGLLYQPRMIVDDECGAVSGMTGNGNRSTRKKTCSYATLSTTNPT